MNTRNDLEKFERFLQIEEESVIKELEPYFQRLVERESSHMNTYGLLTPNDKLLLQKIEAIQTLIRHIKESKTLKELEERLKVQVEKSQKKQEINRIKRQLQYITEYFSEKEEEKITDTLFKTKIKK